MHGPMANNSSSEAGTKIGTSAGCLCIAMAVMMHRAYEPVRLGHSRIAQH